MTEEKKVTEPETGKMQETADTAPDTETASEKTAPEEKAAEGEASAAAESESEPAGEADAGEGTEAADGAAQDDGAEACETPEGTDGEETDDAEAAGEDDSGAPDKKGKKGFFKKKEKKDPKDEKIAELTDRLQRQMAEFDNFRKRTEKEKASMYQIGAKDVIEKLLPVVDNFERGLETGDESDPFVDGMNKIYKQLTTMLTDLGVTPIEAVGQPFDPDLHNAVMHVDDESLGENIVAEEFQKGYKYKDAVVRFSMVKVAN